MMIRKSTPSSHNMLRKPGTISTRATICSCCKEPSKPYHCRWTKSANQQTRQNRRSAHRLCCRTGIQLKGHAQPTDHGVQTVSPYRGSCCFMVFPHSSHSSHSSHPPHSSHMQLNPMEKKSPRTRVGAVGRSLRARVGRSAGNLSSSRKRLSQHDKRSHEAH